MRFRGKSIRRKIVALLLVPLVSLTALWSFSTIITSREAVRLLTVAEVVDKIGYPIEDMVQAVQEERRQSLTYLADPRASEALSDLRLLRGRTDKLVAKIRGNATDSGVAEDLDTESRGRLSALLDALDGLESLRHAVEEGTVSRSTALDLYNRLIDPSYALLMTVHGLDDPEMDKQGRALVGLARARELLSREDALLGSALAARRLTRHEIRDISDLVAQRTLLYEVNLTLLPEAERVRYERFWRSADATPLRVAEESVSAASPGTASMFTAASWNRATDAVLDELATRNAAANDRYQDRVHPIAVGVIARAVIAGILGLIALLFSVFLSVRVGRGLIRDLRTLRLDAHEASGVRLPGVMRRLAAGEQVDVETEAPRLEFGKDEIGQVGLALNTLQRAAVEATVKQAELRHGVSDVFVNLARRSQVLLHKQLTLLDTMERRTEDTDELADLFRLDHLTTRMRRHAEGLVILSGAAPSRQWRKPVQLMDVVRASVGEVEDYERIEVRRLPRIAVTGPAVADLTHLVAELLENATLYSPPHTAVQVHGDYVANGFTLEIHDRGLGMASDALLDANLRLSETPEFELSDTDRLGLFVVSRLAQRQNVRVSLQPSPYGGTTAVVFLPETLLTDAGGITAADAEDAGLRTGRSLAEAGSRPALGRSAAKLPGLPPSLLDVPVELEAPVGSADDIEMFPARRRDNEREHALLGPRRTVTALPDDQQPAEDPEGATRGSDDERPGGAVPLPRRHTPKLVSSHGRPVVDPEHRVPDPAADRPTPETPTTAPVLPRRRRFPEATTSTPARGGDAAPPSASPRDAAPDRGAPGRGAPGLARLDRVTGERVPRAGDGPAEPADGALPRRVRQANLAPQLKKAPTRRGGGGPVRPAEERDAEEVRSRMASLQRGWARGREENAEGDTAPDGTAQGTTSEGDGR
ncbi:nitrate- and nitrite sensing domain-containing protein [Streptomyces uncialis]|uniref:nitrate- and nitrite sensing domain-containing protein n=1 Tax=Streptomyces uncialis TaxID=1048205 RepID=UPI003870C982|nr:nitrate- and nitrite sensing domain-containing protein [Streptomyces uncialis]